MTTVSTQAKHLALLLITALVVLVMAGCASQDAPQPQYQDASSGTEIPVAVTVPDLSEKAQAGEAVFNTSCSACHGMNAAGTGLGPPLVHKIYEPGHHQDFSFRNAVQNGVMSHHWQFGNMAPVPGVAEDDVERIICYVRELQRANGIFEDERGLAAC